jgi:hypothetical protein
MHSLTLIVPSSSVQNSTGPATAGRVFVLIALALAWFAVSPTARAACRVGCDIDTSSTALGDDALINNTGNANTATGFSALQDNTTGAYNTATGLEALLKATTADDNTATGALALQADTTLASITRPRV